MAAALVFLGGATGLADDEVKKGGAERKAEGVSALSAALHEDLTLESREVLALPSAAAQGFSGSVGTRVELFARPGLSLLNVSAEDSIQASFPGESGGDSLSASRLVSEFGYGGGLRLLQGNWGIEGTYHAFESLALTPSWLVIDAAGAPEGEPNLAGLPIVASSADVFLGQGIRTFRIGRGGAEVFFGIGAGWMRVADSSTDRLLSGAGVEGLDEIPAEIPPFLVPEVSFEADRSSVVYAGSFGVAFRVGRMLVRPRVDVIISPALTTDLTIGFPPIDDPLLGELASLEFGYSTSVKPTIYLISVDFGISN